MGCIFSCWGDEPELLLTDKERETIANKRLQYIENKFSQKPIDKTRRIDIPFKEDRIRDQYIKDWRD